MSSGTMVPEEATKRLESRVDGLREATRSFLEGRGGTASLSELLGYLRDRDRGDEVVSRAIAGLRSMGQLVVTTDRHVVLRDL